MATQRCPECGTPVGPRAGIDPYKHAVACLHVPNEGRERVLQLLEDRDDEYARRVRELLLAPAGGE
jgi:hypothetical protein